MKKIDGFLLAGEERSKALQREYEHVRDALDKGVRLEFGGKKHSDR